MTRTARKNAKKAPLPATPWEELKQPYLKQNKVDEKLRKVKKQDLKVTHKKKLGPETTKTQLKRITGKQLKRSLSDNVRLLEGPQLGECAGEFTNEEMVSGKTHKKQSKEKGALDQVHGLDVVQTTEIKTTPKKHKRQKLVSSLSVHTSKKKRSINEDKVSLLVSDSDSSLSNKAEVLDEEEEEGDSKSDGDEREVEGCEEGGVEGERSAVVTSEKKNAKRTKVTKRIKVGKRWVKEADTNGGTVREGEGGATRRKEIDDEKRKKRIEQRRLRRQRKKVCFSCRQPGHWVGDCPLNSRSTGICFKCGSSEHTCQQCRVKVPPGEFPYAKCFICSEVGHLSRSCPDNPRGLYPRGGGCKVCGSVEHLRANCPFKTSSNNNMNPGSGSTIGDTCNGDATVSADAQTFTTDTPPPKKKSKMTSRKKEKIIKF